MASSPTPKCTAKTSDSVAPPTRHGVTHGGTKVYRCAISMNCWWQTAPSLQRGILLSSHPDKNDEYETERLRSLNARIAELPKDPAVLVRLLEQRHLLELLAWDNCPEWVALRQALAAQPSASVRSNALAVLIDAVQYAVNRLDHDPRGPQQIQVSGDLAVALAFARSHAGTPQPSSEPVADLERDITDVVMRCCVKTGTAMTTAGAINHAIRELLHIYVAALPQSEEKKT